MGRRYIALTLLVLAACTNLTPPGKPTSFTASSSPTPSINLTWATTQGATSYVVERKNSDGNFEVLSKPSQVGYTDSTVSFGSTYSYQLKAVNSAGSSDWVALEATAVLPNPSNLKITASSIQSIALTWDAVAGASGYVLERKVDAEDFRALSNPSSNNFTDSNINVGSSYSYRVRATNPGGNSNPSNEAGVPTLILPPDPTNLSALSQTTAKTVVLNWNAVTGAISYSLERKTAGGSYAPVANNINATTFSDSDNTLTASTGYTYRLKSVNPAGYSPGAEVSVTTPDPPSTPSNLTALATTSSGTSLTWTAANRASGYTLERRPGGGSYANLANPTTNLYADSGLDSFKTYYYRLTANNAWGNSAQVEAGLTTFPNESGFTPNANLSSQGYFGNVIGADDLSTPTIEGWPLVPTFVSLLPPDQNGKTKIFAWYSSDPIGVNLGQWLNHPNTTLAVLWDYTNPDPSTAFEIVNNNTHTDLFCAGLVVLPDGKLYTAGGQIGYWTDGYAPGSNHTDIFDPVSKTWSNGPDMNDHRWYPSVITLSDGRLLIVGGSGYNKWITDTTQSSPNGVTDNIANRDVEIWNTQTSTVNTLPGAQLAGVGGLPTSGSLFYHYYPWLFQVPNGKVFLAGAGTPAYLDVSGNGAWSNISATAFSGGSYGSAVMYAPNQIIGFGGGYWSNTTASTNADTVFKISLNTSNTSYSAKILPTKLFVPRTHVNATLLPDGKVFVNGGNQSGANWVYDQNYNTVASNFRCKNASGQLTTNGLDCEAANKISEIWDPVAETHIPGAAAQVVRQYHSTALLLPDGRVLTAGGGGNGNVLDPGGRDLNQRSSEMYYPYYLFKANGQLAARPTITQAPTSIGYGSSFTLQTDLPAAQISKVTLLKLGSVTHTFNMGQHVYYPNIQSRSGNQLTLATPPSGNWAPPGFYMVFVLDGNGVPSEAKVVRLQ